MPFPVMGFDGVDVDFHRRIVNGNAARPTSLLSRYCFVAFNVFIAFRAPFSSFFPRLLLDSLFSSSTQFSRLHYPPSSKNEKCSIGYLTL